MVQGWQRVESDERKMNAGDKDIIEMRPSEDDSNGDSSNRHYTYVKFTQSKNSFPAWLFKILGIALGVAIFLLLIFFFVYVIIPLILIVIVYSLLRNIFKPRR